MFSLPAEPVSNSPIFLMVQGANQFARLPMHNHPVVSRDAQWYLTVFSYFFNVKIPASGQEMLRSQQALFTSLWLLILLLGLLRWF